MRDNESRDMVAMSEFIDRGITPKTVGKPMTEKFPGDSGRRGIAIRMLAYALLPRAGHRAAIPIAELVLLHLAALRSR